MGLRLAFKAFMKAFKEPEKAQQFVQDEPVIPPNKQISLSTTEQSHLRLLARLQQESRLLDFLKEDLTGFDDAQVGAAVRKIHQDCAQALEDLVTVRPLRDEAEGATIQVLKGYDPTEVKIVGKVKGEPPFTGVLIHRGWKAHKRSLPKQTQEYALDVLCPAEIEIKS